MRHDDKHGHSDYDPIPDTGKLYETRDVVLSALAKWITFLFVFVGGTALVTFAIYKVFVPKGEEDSQFPLPRVKQQPQDPKLQANPVADIKKMREDELIAQGGYGRDPRTGAIHIPIERAMELTLPELPTREGAGTIDYTKTTAPNTPSHFDGQAPAGAAPSPPITQPIAPPARPAVPANAPTGAQGAISNSSAPAVPAAQNSAPPVPNAAPPVQNTAPAPDATTSPTPAAPGSTTPSVPPSGMSGSRGTNLH